MRKALLVFLAVGLLGTMVCAQQTAVKSSNTDSHTISGDYVETRSADVYVGQCFANGEMGTAGDSAILAWHIREGSFEGVSLAGLNVVGAVKAQATLGDPYGKPYPAKSVLMVDRDATPRQRQALIDFAQEMGGDLLRHVVKVMDVPIAMQVFTQNHGRASIRAGEFVTVETRAIGDKDHLCGNEATFYPPLTATTHAMPAVAMTDEYQGQGLNVTWTLHDKRSAFVGNFTHSDNIQSRHEYIVTEQPSAL